MSDQATPGATPPKCRWVTSVDVGDLHAEVERGCAGAGVGGDLSSSAATCPRIFGSRVPASEFFEYQLSVVGDQDAGTLEIQGAWGHSSVEGIPVLMRGNSMAGTDLNAFATM